MAINPSSAYSGQIDTTDPVGYPFGRPRNDGAAGDGKGTPLEQQWVSDLFGFWQALLADAGITPTATPDKVGASQYLSAIKTLSTRIGDARVKAALTKYQAINWPERAAFGSIAAVNTPQAVIWAPQFGVAGAGLWCLLDAGRSIYTSSDGGAGGAVAWNATATLPFASTTKPELAFGDLDGVPILLANCGSLSNFYTSTDGNTWSRWVAGPAITGNCFAYSSSLNRWVSVGATDHGTTAQYATATSSGFGNWTQVLVPGAWVTNSGGCKRLVWNGALFVALPVSSYDKCLTSPDGITWTERTLPATGFWTGLAYSDADGIWMASSNGTMVATSPDGFTWTPYLTTVANNDLAVSGSLWIMPTSGGLNGGIAYSVDKGVSWRSVTVGKHNLATSGWSRIASGDNRFLVTHADGTNIETCLSVRTPD